jgi:two-component system, cell cycle response regulator CtrA
MRILIVEDEVNVVNVMEMKLHSAGFTTFSTPSGEEAVGLAKLYDFDLVVLDLNLPDISGLIVLRNLRDAHVKTPVLILSGDESVDKMLRCFGLGADDFLMKPYRGDELIARIKAVILRSNGHASPKVQIGDIMIELETKRVTVAEQELVLTRREYQILELLVMRKGNTVTKEAFLNHLYGGQDEPDQKIIDVYVCKLRKKIAALTRVGEYIETVWGRGYTLHVPAMAAPQNQHISAA